jgi:hypothetical protein
MSEDIVKRDEAGPDEAIRLRATPDEADTEGHKKVIREGDDAAAAPGPDEAVKRNYAKDDDAPGPDETRFSDRNLKTGIVPVEW